MAHACGSACLLLGLMLPGLAASASVMYLETLQWTYPDAVCMDGTPSGYYWRPSTNKTLAGHIWLVFLQPGGWCASQGECDERCAHEPHLCSSEHWESEMPMEGIFTNEAEDPLAHANKVFVRYCTSDAHMGDGEAFGYQFRGERVVQSVLDELVSRRGLGRRPHQRDLLIFGGSSAGSRGAMVHLDYVNTMLGPEAAANVELYGYLDSPAWMDVPPLNHSFEGFAHTTQAVYSFANVSNFGPLCEEMYGDSDELWKCMFGEFRLPLITTRYLVVATQYDSYQLNGGFGRIAPGVQWIDPPDYSQVQTTYADRVAAKTREFMHSLAQPGRGVYSPTCYSHAVSTGAWFSEHTCADGTSRRQALLQFVGLEPRAKSSSLEWIDDCEGLDCGAGCFALVEGASPSSEVSVASRAAFAVSALLAALAAGLLAA